MGTLREDIRQTGHLAWKATVAIECLRDFFFRESGISANAIEHNAKWPDDDPNKPMIARWCRKQTEDVARLSPTLAKQFLEHCATYDDLCDALNLPGIREEIQPIALVSFGDRDFYSYMEMAAELLLYRLLSIVWAIDGSQWIEISQDDHKKMPSFRGRAFTAQQFADNWKKAADSLANQPAVDAKQLAKDIYAETRTAMRRYPGESAATSMGQQLSVPQLPAIVESAEPEQSLVLNGEFWSVTFAGQTGSLKNTSGMHYLAKLLQNPNESIAADSLMLAIKPTNGVACRDRKSVSETESMDTGLRPDNSQAEVRLDKVGRQKLQAAVLVLNDQIDTAKMSGDIREADRLTDERDEIEKEIRTAQTFLGHERTTNDPERSKFNSVKQAVERVLRKIRANNDLATLAEHLKESIKYSQPDCEYRPKGNPPTWIIQA